MLPKSVPARILAQLKADAPTAQHPWIHLHIHPRKVLCQKQGQEKESEEEQTKKAFSGLPDAAFPQTEFLEQGPP